MKITLDSLLASRDARKAMQKRLLNEYPNLTLICLTVIMPGNVKRNSYSLTTAKAAVDSIRQTFADSLCKLTEYDLETGYEAFALVERSPLETKKMTCEIEDRHPLGRLFDLDVIDPVSHEPIARNAVGHAERRCLLCKKAARYCMRNKSHSLEDIQQCIQQIVDAYV